MGKLFQNIINNLQFFWKIWGLKSWKGLLLATDVSTTCREVIFRVKWKVFVSLQVKSLLLYICKSMVSFDNLSRSHLEIVKCKVVCQSTVLHTCMNTCWNISHQQESFSGLHCTLAWSITLEEQLILLHGFKHFIMKYYCKEKFNVGHSLRIEKLT